MSHEFEKEFIYKEGDNSNFDNLIKNQTPPFSFRNTTEKLIWLNFCLSVWGFAAFGLLLGFSVFLKAHFVFGLQLMLWFGIYKNYKEIGGLQPARVLAGLFGFFYIAPGLGFLLSGDKNFRVASLIILYVGISHLIFALFVKGSSTNDNFTIIENKSINIEEDDPSDWWKKNKKGENWDSAHFR